MRPVPIVNLSTYKHAPVGDITNALTKQLHDYADAWGREETEHTLGLLHQAGYRIILFDDAEQAHHHGFRDLDPHGNPYGRVFIRPILDHHHTWAGDNGCVSMAVSHELLETLTDPGANRWVDDGLSTLWAIEACDWTEARGYDIGDIRVSNFAHPDYFNPYGTGTLDHMGLATEPLSIRDGSYAIRHCNGKVETVFGLGYEPWRWTECKRQEGSRTWARLRGR